MNSHNDLSTLHLVMSGKPDMTALVRMLKEQDAVVVMGEGLYVQQPIFIACDQHNIPCMCLEADDPTDTLLKPISFDTLAALVVRYAKSISW